MTQSAHKPTSARRVAAIAAALLASACLWLLSAAPAQAALEQVGCFAGGLAATEESPAQPCAPVESEEFIEEVQLGGVGGMAVNYTGAGGVPEGTVYAATKAAGSADAGGDVRADARRSGIQPALGSDRKKAALTHAAVRGWGSTGKAKR